jgi:hypothetical protein
LWVACPSEIVVRGRRVGQTEQTTLTKGYALFKIKGGHFKVTWVRKESTAAFLCHWGCFLQLDSFPEQNRVVVQQRQCNGSVLKTSRQ